MSALRSRSSLVCAVRAAQREADARPDDRRRVAQLDRLGQPVEEPLADRRDDLRRLDVLEQDRELVAAEPARRVAGPDDRLDALRDHLERAVALGVPEAIVQELEVVEVDEQHGGVIRAPPAKPVERVVHAILEPGSVGEAGERVAVARSRSSSYRRALSNVTAASRVEQLRELDVARRERVRALRAELHDADRFAADDERDHHQRLLPDRAHVGDLRGVGGRDRRCSTKYGSRRSRTVRVAGKSARSYAGWRS